MQVKNPFMKKMRVGNDFDEVKAQLGSYFGFIMNKMQNEMKNLNLKNIKIVKFNLFFSFTAFCS